MLHRCRRPTPLARVCLTSVFLLISATAPSRAVVPPGAAPPPDLAPFFAPPDRYRGDLGPFRSPLLFDDGSPVRTPADWQRRRLEILSTWHTILGRWPDLFANPRVEVVNGSRRENVTRQQLRIEIGLDHESVDALLLLPDSRISQKKRPAVLVVYYDAQTAAGYGPPLRDFAWQLAKRGFVALSIGMPTSHIDLDATRPNRAPQYVGPAGKPITVQPLSALAYAAANAHTVLARRSDVDPDRIGIVGHSFGGKWAMFASCLYDKFAAAVWSDPGVVFDERDRRKQNPGGSINYWDVWYLGAQPGAILDPENAGPFRALPSEGQPRTGAYKTLVESGHDLVELHALMAPRPFLASGGTADLAERWPALNHAVAVNALLGYQNRVALTSRPTHSPTEESNAQIYRFFEWASARGGRAPAVRFSIAPGPTFGTGIFQGSIGVMLFGDMLPLTKLMLVAWGFAVALMSVLVVAWAVVVTMRLFAPPQKTKKRP